MSMRKKMHPVCHYVIAPAAVLFLAVVSARADVAVSNRTVTTPRHIFTLDDTGLPSQLAIRAFTNDIPLAYRAEKKWQDALLKMLSRGPQLASPMRIDATVDKSVIPAKADAPATINKTDKGTEATSTWQAGSLKGRLSVLYAHDGSMTGQITYDAKGTDLERLDLVMELSGPLDTVIAGSPAVLLAGKQQLAPDYGTLATGSGIVWSDGDTPVGDGSKQKGQIRHFFLGNGDHGFTWLPNGEGGFAIGGKEPSMTVERKKDGPAIWKIAIANKSPRGGEQTAAFTLLVHPSRLPADDRRQQQWQPWTDKAAAPALDAASRGTLTGSNLLVRADAGSVCEAVAARAILEGPIGGDALTATNTVADRYPLALFRYLAATHTALAAQLRSNGGTLAMPGGSLAVDNMILGRALVHDIGVDVAGLANCSYAADVVNALESFGYFKNDGQTEFLPYWRAEDFGIGLVRYGTQFEADAKQGFALTTENPAGRVRVSLFLRPVPGGRKVMMVLVNESDHPVRELLYIENPDFLFGGDNKVNFVHVLAEQDTSYIPDASDWRRKESIITLPMGDEDVKVNIKLRTQKDKAVRAAKVVGCLQDPITGGYVKTSKMGPGFTLFGPLYIPARGMRLLTASAAPEGGVVGSVWRVTKDGKRTPVADAPVYAFGSSGVPVVEKMEQSKVKPLVTVRTARDGTFRVKLGAMGIGGNGLSGGDFTVVAEVDGKLYPDRQILGRGKEGIGFTWPTVRVGETHKFSDLLSETFYWADCTIEALEGNAMPRIPEGPEKPEAGKPWTAPHTGIEFVWVPAGEFDMGSPASEAGRSDNETLHHVTLTKGFWMSKYEITQGQWMRITGNNPSKFKYAGDQAPVENVGFLGVEGFVRRLNDLAYGSGVRYLLPTEAQWEYACRAGSKTALYNGALTIKGAYNGPELDEIAWYGGNSGISNALAFDTRKWRERQFDSPYSGTHPVGQKKPNAFGLYDMIGNVAEWTCEVYSNDLGTAAVTDPLRLFVPVPGDDVARPVMRGSSWLSMPSYCRAAYRQPDLSPWLGDFTPPFNSFDTGLRLVCVMNQEPVITAMTASATNGTAPLTVEFKATVTDADGDKLSSYWKFGDKNQRGGGAASGSVVTNTYEKFGTNLVSLFVTDGKGDGISNSLAIVVTRGANRLPVAWDSSITNKSGMPSSIKLPVRDDDDDPLQCSIVTQPQHGEVTCYPRALEYKSKDTYRGLDSFTFKAWDAVKVPDGTVQTNYTKEATVSITVEPR
jgi:formylglycine-generating enzyme required for sulfatase activity